MNFGIDKALLAAAVLTSALMPAASNANENEPLDRCVQTFIKEVVPPAHAVEIRYDDIRDTTRKLGANRSSVDVVARGEKNGKLFGRATCVLDSGALVAMYVYESRPLVAGYSRPRDIDLDS